MARPIVVEGPDGAGKTTLVGKLKLYFARPLIHTGGPPKNRQEWVDRLIMVAGHQSEAVLFDRLPQISEQVYGSLYDRPPFDLPETLDRDLEEMQPVVIYCRLKSIQDMANAISQNWKPHKPREHLDKVLAGYPSLVRQYDDLMDRLASKVTIIQYSWVDDSYLDLIEQIKNGLRGSVTKAA